MPLTRRQAQMMLDRRKRGPAVMTTLQMVECARSESAVAVSALTQIATDRKAHAIARVAAARELLDRGYGTPRPVADDAEAMSDAMHVNGGSVAEIARSVLAAVAEGKINTERAGQLMHLIESAANVEESLRPKSGINVNVLASGELSDRFKALVTKFFGDSGPNVEPGAELPEVIALQRQTP